MGWWPAQGRARKLCEHLQVRMSTSSEALGIQSPWLESPWVRCPWPHVFCDWRKIRSRVTTDLKAVEPDGAKTRDLPHGSWSVRPGASHSVSPGAPVLANDVLQESSFNSPNLILLFLHKAWQDARLTSPNMELNGGPAVGFFHGVSKGWLKKEENCVISSNVDAPWGHYAKWHKPRHR